MIKKKAFWKNLKKKLFFNFSIILAEPARAVQSLQKKEGEYTMSCQRK